MNIEDAPLKRADEIRRQYAHEARQTDQVDLRIAQRRDELLFERFALFALGRYAKGLNPEPLRDFETLNAFLVTDDDGDFGPNLACLDALSDRLEVGTPTGK